MSVDVSVVIATHQRRQLLLANLEALAQQAGPGFVFEVVVAADSCTDGTREAVEARTGRWPMEVRVVEHAGGNASKTRNLGAAVASGSWLVFIDDDICPAPGFLAAHLDARREASLP